MSTGNAALVTTLADASRYLTALTATVGFDESVRRVRGRADPAVVRELDTLQRYVKGGDAKPASELALYGDFVKGLPAGVDSTAGAATLAAAQDDARRLADGVRVGLPGDLSYPAVLLAIAAAVSLIWFIHIAPSFAAMFDGFGAGGLPGLSQIAFDAPWLVFAVIVLLAAALALFVAGFWRLADSIETLEPPAQSWVRRIAGARVVAAQRQWCLATMASAWADAGQDPAHALEAARARAGAAAGSPDALDARLDLAAALGVARQELAYQREQCLRDCRVALDLRRAIAVRGMQAAVAVLIGAIVIAIYLPIFRMGAVI